MEGGARACGTMTTLYFFWSSPEAARVRLALHCKEAAFAAVPVAYGDDATFFDLGVARHPVVLQMADGRLLPDSLTVLREVDCLFPGAPPLWDGVVDPGSWNALLEWRTRADAVLTRLYAPLAPAYRDIAGDDDTLQAYKRDVQSRFGLSLEELANDRYAAYAQFAQLSRIEELGSYLSTRRFYLGRLSSADLLLAADLFPLQLLDGVTLPIDLMYYLERIEQACRCSLREGLFEA